MDIGDRLLKLVEIPSVTGNEQGICDFLIEAVGSTPGYAMQRVGDSFSLFPTKRSGAPLVAFVGHLDTVPPSAKNPPRRDDERVWGLGSCDMKSGLAIMWELLVRPVQPARYDLAYIFYSGEEGSYEASGLGPLLDEITWGEQIDLAIILEPSDNIIHLGCMGCVEAKIGIRGRAAHSARPWQGENAIHKAAPLLTKLSQLKPVEVEVGGFSFRNVMSVTLANGGTARNVIPDLFTLNLNYRFAPDRTLEQAEADVRELVGDLADVSFPQRFPPGIIPEGNAILEHLKPFCPGPPAPKQAWTDVGRLSAAGIPAINFGPGENHQAHQPNESTSIPLLDEGDALVRRFLAPT